MRIEYMRPNLQGYEDIDLQKIGFENNQEPVTVSQSGTWTTINVPGISRWITLVDGYSIGDFHNHTSHGKKASELNYKYNGTSQPNCLKAYISVPFSHIGTLWDEMLPSVIQHGFHMKMATPHLQKRLEDPENSQFGKTFVIYLGQEKNYSFEQWQDFFNNTQDIINKNNMEPLGKIKDVFQFSGTDHIFCRQERGEDGVYTYEHSELPENSLFRNIEISTNTPSPKM